MTISRVPILLSILTLGAAAVLCLLWMQRAPGEAASGVERTAPQAGPPRSLPSSSLPGNVPVADHPSAAPRLPETGREGLGGLARDPVPDVAQGLRGRVVDSDGAPVAAARIFLGPRQGPATVPQDLISPSAPWAHRRAQGRSAPDGTFRLPDVAGGDLSLAVRAEGFAPLRSAASHPGPGGDLGDLVLERGVILEGRVVDEHGRPVPGVEVHADPPRSLGYLVFRQTRAGTKVAETDAGGAFRIDELAAGPFVLHFHHPAHPDQRLEGSTERSGMRVTGLLVALERGFEVRGHARELGEHDPAAFLVRARERQSPRSAFDLASFQRARSAPVAPDGSFVLGGLREGRPVDLVLAAAEAEGGPYDGERSRTVTVTPPARGVELVLRRDSALVMRVVDARTGEPIEDLALEVGGRWRVPISDAQGRTVLHYPGGRVRYEPLDTANPVSVRVTAEGYGSFEREGLTAEPGQELDLGEVALVPAPYLEVRVTSLPDGAPVPNASVSLAEQRDGDWLGSLAETLGEDVRVRFDPGAVGETRRASTDALGVARVTALPGRTCTLLVVHPEHVEYRSEAFLVGPRPDAPVEVVLGRGGAVSVRVVDGAGEPLEGVTVAHRGPDGTGPGPSRILGRPRQTDRTGSVRFERLQPGRHGFRVDGRAAGTPGAGAVVLRLDVAGRPGVAAPEAPWTEALVGEGTIAELVLTAPRRGVLSGRVTEGGLPLAGAALSLHEPGAGDVAQDLHPLVQASLAQARSGGEGGYAFEPLAAGPYRLRVSHPLRAMPLELEVSLEPGPNELDIALPLTTIAGTVRGEDGRPIEGAAVRAEAPQRGGPRTSGSFRLLGADRSGSVLLASEGRSQVRTDALGRYELRGVQADRDLEVRVEASGDWQPGRSQSLRLRLDENRNGVDVVLALGGALAVRVLNADGSTPQQCFLSADFVGQAEERPASRRELARGEGSIRLGGLRPGTWRLMARGLDVSGRGAAERVQGSATPLEVEVRAGEEVSVVLRLH